MQLVMFDIDGTLVESTAFDADCYTNAVEDELNISISKDWSIYKNVTDAGILQEILDLHNIKIDLDNIITPIKKRFFDGIKKHLNITPLKKFAAPLNF